ncbi:ABC transporter permease subunit [Desulfatirhabdium butyrativorans]|uniref:ABC transporter permease subunit n=1 Tax=Desulfatirhabdium butyrativorans TaxID=340467 RepID=UPI000416C678|nr:ABC transporter permease subunit [Desulfatirhabdium butyrativorans]
MIAYILRRLALIVPTFVGITIVVFAITRFVPGGPVERMMLEAQRMRTSQFGGRTGGIGQTGNQPLSADQIAQLKAYYGFDKPVLESYLGWMHRVLSGDLGTSTRYYEPVWDMIRQRIPISLYFGLFSLFLTYGICIPLGIAKAVRHKSGFDNLTSIVVFVAHAIPGWVIGVLLLLLFASTWEIFPLGGLTSDDFADFTLLQQAIDILWHTVLPLVAYVAGSFSVLTFLMKNSLMDNLASDYMRTAMAKGLSFKQAVFRHALQNSLVPIATSFGNNISIVLSGSFLIEKVFNINGMGLLGYEAVMDRDYPVVMGILVISALLFMIGNILSDICVAIVDPRVSFE